MADTEHCLAVYVLTAVEAQRLADLPDAANEVEDDVRCELGQHDSTVHHCALAQSQDRSHDDFTNWWLRWDDGGDVRFTHEPTCLQPIEGGMPDDDCLLFSGHPGRCLGFEEA